MGKIDDPYDEIRSQFPEAPDNVPGELALRIAGVVFPVVGIVNVVRDYYSTKSVTERLEALIEVVNSKTNATEANTNSPKFAESVRLAIEETWRTTDREKVKRFGAILGNSLAQGVASKALDEAAEFIRDVAQLSERDIKALNWLNGVAGHLMGFPSNPTDPSPFIDAFADAIRSSNEERLALDDFYASCKRLEGFGLAIQLPRKDSRMAPGEYAFRPTGRGQRLIELLSS